MKLKEIYRFFYIIKIFLMYGIDELIYKRHLKFLFFLFRSIIFWIPKKNKINDIGYRIKITLETLGPVWIKFGQMLSTRLDFIPGNITRYLMLLQDQVEPFNSLEAIQIIETSLGSSIDKYFFNFNNNPLASASISQVHAAYLKTNNEPIIIKVLRPKIKNLIKKDIKLMYFLSHFLNFFFKKFRRFRFLEIVSVYEKILLNEINFLNEIKNTIQLKKNFKDSNILYIPKVYSNYSSKSILVVERIYGIPISNISALKEHGIDMKVLAERGVQIFFTQVFRDSFFHADMHPGNIFVSYISPNNPKYIGIDCGIIGSLNKDDKRYLAENFIAFFNRNYKKIAQLHIDSGWVSPETDILELEKAIYSVFEPIFKKPLQDISFGSVLLKLFNTAKRFNMQVQPQLILLQKTLFYVEGIGRQLYPNLDLWETAKPFLENWIKNEINIFSIINNTKKKLPYVISHIPDFLDSISNNMRFLKKIKYSIDNLSNKYNLHNKKQKKVYYIFIILIIFNIITIFLYQESNVLKIIIAVFVILTLFI